MKKAPTTMPKALSSLNHNQKAILALHHQFGYTASHIRHLDITSPDNIAKAGEKLIRDTLNTYSRLYKQWMKDNKIEPEQAELD